jgi:uncharacterized protein YlxP (DUF503 family)
VSSPRAFVAVLTIHLHFPDCESLKAKRRELHPVKTHLQRIGASAAEVGHQDHWQRATLVAALAGGSPVRLEAAIDGLERWLDARFPAGVRVERRLTSLQDLDD